MNKGDDFEVDILNEQQAISENTNNRNSKITNIVRMLTILNMLALAIIAMAPSRWNIRDSQYGYGIVMIVWAVTVFLKKYGKFQSLLTFLFLGFSPGHNIFLVVDIIIMLFPTGKVGEGNDCFKVAVDNRDGFSHSVTLRRDNFASLDTFRYTEATTEKMLRSINSACDAYYDIQVAAMSIEADEINSDWTVNDKGYIHGTGIIASWSGKSFDLESNAIEFEIDPAATDMAVYNLINTTGLTQRDKKSEIQLYGQTTRATINSCQTRLVRAARS